MGVDSVVKASRTAVGVVRREVGTCAVGVRLSVRVRDVDGILGASLGTQRPSRQAGAGASSQDVPASCVGKIERVDAITGTVSLANGVEEGCVGGPRDLGTVTQEPALWCRGASEGNDDTGREGDVRPE